MASVLVFVFDGLQPAQVTKELMPNLAAVAAEGVFFERHHPVYPTVTRVNVASMMTGRYPGGHGLAGNSLVVREFDSSRAIPALKPELSRVADRTGRLLLAPHLAQVLGARGREYIAVGTGSDGNAYLHNPFADQCGGATLHPQFSLPANLNGEIAARIGQWPGTASPDEGRLDHAARITTEYVLPERDPAVALLWSCEPDSSQHKAGVGSRLAIRSLAAADRALGTVLAWLRDTGRDAETDLLAVSDHGYSTVTEAVAVEAMLREAGFPPGGQPGGVIVAPNGGSVLFYVDDRDRPTADRLAAWLMGQPWCGAIVASEQMGEVPGTLPAALVGTEGPRAPDIAMSFRWDSEPNAGGYQGHSFSTSKVAGQGNHGSMSAHELRCVMIAKGPSFKRRLRVEAPSGNVDLMPTVLRVLGVAGPKDMEGRVLEDALVGGPEPTHVPWSTETRSAQRRTGAGVYRQHITVSRVGSTTYVDGGNGGLLPE